MLCADATAVYAGNVPGSEGLLRAGCGARKAQQKPNGVAVRMIPSISPLAVALRVAEVRSCAVEILLCSPALFLVSRDRAEFAQFQRPRSWLKKSQRTPLLCPRFAAGHERQHSALVIRRLMTSERLRFPRKRSFGRKLSLFHCCGNVLVQSSARRFLSRSGEERGRGLTWALPEFWPPDVHWGR